MSQHFAVHVIAKIASKVSEFSHFRTFGTGGPGRVVTEDIAVKMLWRRTRPLALTQSLSLREQD
jgi:hypothetical protein